MQPQYLAVRFSCGRNTEALPSQSCRLRRAGYVFGSDYLMVPARNTQVSLTSETERARQFNNARSTHIDRRQRCQRASNSWQPLVSSPLLLPVHPARPKKNMLLSSPSPSRLSQHTQVSTSKLAPGQAQAPVPTSFLTIRQTRPQNRRAV